MPDLDPAPEGPQLRDEVGASPGGVLWVRLVDDPLDVLTRGRRGQIWDLSPPAT